MEMFDTHRRDVLNFDNYMDLKKPGFGGPKSAIALKDGRGKLVNDKPKLDGYRRTVERDPAFSHPVYDPTYKAMTHDLVYKQEKKKPFIYDHTRTGIPVVEIEPVDEGKTYTSFEQFINEALDDQMDNEESDNEIYDPIRAAHAEYESPMDRRYNSQDWVDAQNNEEGGDEEDEDEEDDPYFEDELRDSATKSNLTLSQIEDKLRGFEDSEYGANPSQGYC
jgi:hypothetical protein